ncbi:MAG: sulfite exporter TauE/SafE family protein [Candidatus Tectomicrobia bacterium]|uniref:Probable membrane transporter protein n=1 Tax=Tectimicrobiota bacterium TaxID=2528274 RepID=A0A933GKQ8_UNCTE|nr:sulfite exporter TauE/SafE family protein [Candidatus Tectomicrobia bacterium]
MDLWQYIVSGLVGGLAQIVDGTLGMGFGLITSSSMMAIGFAPAIAVATINIAKIVTGLASGLSHWRFGNVRRDWLIPLLAGGLIGGILGGLLITSIDPAKTRTWVGIILLLMGGLVIWRTIHWKVYCTIKDKGKECVGCPALSNGNALSPGNKNHTRLKLGGIGFLAAFINGLSGAYGPMATTGVLLLEKGEPRHAIGTVNMAEFFVALGVSITILTKISLSQFPFGLAIALSLGGIFVAPIAAYICRIITPRLLAFMVGISLTGMNIIAIFLLVH